MDPAFISLRSKENCFREAMSFLVALSSTHRAVEVNNLLLTFDDNLIDACPGVKGYSALQFVISMGNWNKEISFGLNSILNKGANLHSVGFCCAMSIRHETPTSLSMYSSLIFMEWRAALLRLPVNLESFVRDEVQQSPLRDAGWDEDSLLALFHCDIQSNDFPSILDYCDDCSEQASLICVELSWQEWLRRFKHKIKAERSPDHESSGAESDRSDGESTGRNFSSLEVEETVLNDSYEGEELLDETVTSDSCESETDTETFDAYFGNGTGIVCMRCYLKRQGYDSDIWSPVG